MRRLLSAAPFILKGAGWYVTDYPSESRKKALETEKGAAKKVDTDKKESPSAEKSSTADSTSTATTSASPAPSRTSPAPSKTSSE